MHPFVDFNKDLIAYWPLNGTWNGSRGEVKDKSGNSGPVRENGFKYSEDFSQAGASNWTVAGTNTGTTYGDAKVNPDGGATSDKLVDADAANPVNWQASQTSVAQGYTFTVAAYVAKTVGAQSSYPGLGVSYSTGAAQIFGIIAIDTSNGIVTSLTAFAPTRSSIVSFDADWWRVSVTFTNPSANTKVIGIVYPAINTDAGATAENAAQGSAYVWGAQLTRTSDIVGYDATTGTAILETGNHGTAVGGLTTSAGGVSGRWADFTAASSQYLDMNAPSSLTTDLNVFTIAMQIKGPFTPATVDPLVSMGGSIPYIQIDNGSDQAILALGNTNFRRFSFSPVNLDDGNEHWVVFLVTGNAQTDMNNSKMYADGQEQVVHSTNVSGSPATKTLFHVGKLGAGNFYDEIIGSIIVWRRILSVPEIVALSDIGIVKPQDALLLKAGYRVAGYR